jgi:hypothetical protein
VRRYRIVTVFAAAPHRWQSCVGNGSFVDGACDARVDGRASVFVRSQCACVRVIDEAKLGMGAGNMGR